MGDCMKKKGFTLIETMAVIVILGILSLIVVPLINDIITSARKKAFKETVNNLLESSSIYEAGYLVDNDNYSVNVINGRKIENDNEVVISKWIADTVLKDTYAKPYGIVSYDHILGL